MYDKVTSIVSNLQLHLVDKKSFGFKNDYCKFFFKRCCIFLKTKSNLIYFLYKYLKNKNIKEC